MGNNQGNKPVRPRDIFVIMEPVTANPTRNGQLRFHSLLKNTGHGSNFLISTVSSLSLSLLRCNVTRNVYAENGCAIFIFREYKLLKWAWPTYGIYIFEIFSPAIYCLHITVDTIEKY